MKKCCRCGKRKKTAEFNKNRTKKDGLTPDCKLCGRLAYQRWRDGYEGRAWVLWHSAQSRANKSGIPFTLTAEWIETRLRSGRCEATGIPFVLTARGKGRKGTPWTPSLDKINPSQGYTPENVRVVCWIYNSAKAMWADSDVLLMAEALCTQQKR